MVNRLHFMHEQSFQAHHQTVNITRALLCELVANRILRRFDDDNPGPEGLLLLANILVTAFTPFQNAPEAICPEDWVIHKRSGSERRLTSLEVAIVSESKHFLSSAASQRVVNAIYTGRVIYTPSSFMDILPDHYKRKPISLYDPRKAGLLNQYRLMVPRTRNILEITQFVMLLFLYFLVMENSSPKHFTIYELVFCIYAFGWVLDQTASMLEHGWNVYTQNLWVFLDVMFAIIYAIYLVLRIHGVAANNDWSRKEALSILATGAPMLVPRLAFNLMSENMLFVSLRAMMADFTVLTGLAVWCFAGFLLAMKWLSGESHRPITISKWMLWVWFGLDGTGIQRSTEIHRILGPILMVTFAFLGNTLFLTILVSMLSNTFSVIVANATAEIQFRRAVLTFEGVKSDAIFAYQPPFNILSLCFLLPLKFFVTPRWFHKVNVLAVRVINAPLLVIINFYERRSLWRQPRSKEYAAERSRTYLAFLGISNFSVHGDLAAVFDSEPPQLEVGERPNTARTSSIIDNDPFNTTDTKSQKGSRGTSPRPGLKRSNTRRDSIESIAGMTENLPNLIHHYLGGGSSAKSRLEALEESTRRIEDMVRKLTDNLDDDNSEGRSD